jgi:hypothetical protein
VGVLAWQWRNMVEFYRAMRAPAVETARETTPASMARPKTNSRVLTTNVYRPLSNERIIVK